MRAPDADRYAPPDPDALAAARNAVADHRSADPEQAVVRDRILVFVDDHPDALLRSCVPGHLTGSAFVLDHDGTHAVLLLHAKLGKWLQPGGHADGDGDLARVAWREATEETGLVGLRVIGGPVDLDIHRVEPPREAPHDHLDVRYALQAPEGAQLVGNHESHELRWVSLDELGRFTDEPGLHRLASSARARLAAGA